MSKSVQNDLKQASLTSFISRNISTPNNKNDIEKIDFDLSCDDIKRFPPKINGTSVPLSEDAVKISEKKSTGKFKFQPRKRKTSFVEISDDSRSPGKIESKSKIFAASAVSDDLFASINSTEESVKIDMSINDLYKKYASPEKLPEKRTPPQSTLNDKLIDLDAALSKNQNYIDAIKKLDKSLEEIQSQIQSPAKTTAVPVSLTKPTFGKFKFNKPRAARLAELDAANDTSDSNDKLPIENSSASSSNTNNRFGSNASNTNTINLKKSTSSTVTSTAVSTKAFSSAPFNTNGSSLGLSNSKTKNISTVTISDDEDNSDINNGGFVPASKLWDPSLIYKTVDTDYSSPTPPLTTNSR